MSLPPNDDTGIPPVPPVPPQPPVPPGPPSPDQPAPAEPASPEAPSFDSAPPAYTPPTYTPPEYSTPDYSAPAGHSDPGPFGSEPQAEGAYPPPPAGAESPSGPAYGAPAERVPGAPAGPAYGAPAAPGYGAAGEAAFPGATTAQGYPGAVPPYAGGGYPGAPYGGQPTPPQGSGKGLAITALVLGIVGVLGIAVAFIPFAGFASLLVPIAAIIIGIIALVKKKPGKGLAITGTALGAVALIACTAIAIAMTTFLIGVAEDPNRFVDEACDAAGLSAEECENLQQDDGFTDPDSAPDGTVDESVDVAASAEVTETAFGEDADGASWYAIVLEQTNPDVMYEYFEVELQALDASGDTVAEDQPAGVLLPGQTIITGTLDDVSAPITEIQLGSLDGDYNSVVELPAGFQGELSYDLTAEPLSGMASISGTVTSTFPEDAEPYMIDIVARDAGGVIVATGYATVEAIPANGTAEVSGFLLGDLPEGGVLEASAAFY
ncbi:hypothetical protein ACOKGD_08950 [Microbacterium phosphatis]|uniref:hypothetical protein n=1 Tax=Microbacterium phosphatis TaxID=3140248 RepID=UPI00313FE813